MENGNDKVYVAYTSSEQGNHFIGRIEKSDIKKFKKNYPNLNYLLVDRSQADIEESAMAKMIVQNNDAVLENQVRSSAQVSHGYNFKLIPRNRYNTIKRWVDNEELSKLEKYRIKYEVAKRCPTCQNFKEWTLKLWKYYLKEYEN